MGLLFYPRGGSAHVARNLATTLPRTGWDVTVLSGSVTMPGHPGDASTFYKGLDVRPVDMTRALSAPDPMAAHPPMHPSYEDRPAAPDRIFARLDDEDAEHQVAAWARALQSVDAANADVLHLHHLTPIYEAAARVAPQVPIVGHLHGTELLMLEAIERDPNRWPYGPAWAERMRELGGPLRAHHRAVRDPGRARRAAAADRARALRADPQRLRSRQLHPAPHRAPRAVAADARRGTARLGARRRAGLRSLLRRRHRRVVLGRHRRDARPALRRPLHRGQADPAADRGLRARPAGLQQSRRRWCSSAASPASGRASTRSRRSAASAPRTSTSPAGTSTTSCRTSSPRPT